MPINLQNPENISTGWGPPPKLDAPSIGSLVTGILENRYRQQALTQKTIGETLKELQSQREEQAYLEAAQRAGLVPEGDTGYGGKYGTTLAKMIQDRQEAESLAKYRGILGDVAQRRTQLSEDWAGTAAEEPETYTDPQGITWRKTRSGWTPMPSGLQSTDVRTQNQHQILTEQNQLLQNKSVMDAEIATERAKNEAAGKANVPYSRSDEYNRTMNRLKQIQGVQSMPGTDVPGASPTPPPSTAPPSDSAAGHAPSYGVDSTNMSADDVRAAYRAGKMTREEAAARLKQLGFGD